MAGGGEGRCARPRACVRGPQTPASPVAPSRAALRAPPVRRRQGSGRAVRREVAWVGSGRTGMAAARFRGLAVAGGGESSESEDDGWEIGYLDRAAQVAEETLFWPHLIGLPWPSKARPVETSYFCACVPLTFSLWKCRPLASKQTREVFLLFPFCAFHHTRFLRSSM